MKKFTGDIQEFTEDDFKKSQQEMIASLYTQSTLFPDDKRLKLPPFSGVRGKRFLPGIDKIRRPDDFLRLKTNIAYCLGSGENYGILCRRFEGWYIKSIMAYIKLQGIDAVYEKMHEKGLGFTGYIIKLKRS